MDDTLQIKGGRGYETADSLRSRGERPDPVERMMRDFRINLIFEGSSEIMRLFIAREAVDTHLKVAGALIDPKSYRRPEGQGALQVGALLRRSGIRSSGSRSRAGSATASSARWPPTCASSSGRSRKLARTLFHCMIRFGPKLEKRQAVLGRLVEIGAELLAISASASRAQAMVKKNPADRSPIELADVFARQARRRVEERFAAVFDNDDVVTYAAARKVLDGADGVAGEWHREDGVAPRTAT